jgi:hypothetical protein
VPGVGYRIAGAAPANSVAAPHAEAAHA